MMKRKNEINAELWKVKISQGFPGHDFHSIILELFIPSMNLSLNFVNGEINCFKGGEERYNNKKLNFLGIMKLPKKMLEKLNEYITMKEDVKKEAMIWYDLNLKSLVENEDKNKFLKMQEAMQVRLKSIIGK